MFKKISMDKAGFSLISVVLALMIVIFLFFGYFGKFQKDPEIIEVINPEVQRAGEAAGVDASTHISVLEGLKEKVGQIEERNRNRGDEIMKEIGDLGQY